MARVKWFAYILNEEGQPIGGANISIYLAGTETPARIYTSNTGGNAKSTAPQLETNDDGYFEFWVADSNETNGYNTDQKFKIAWERTGVASGYNDYIDIFPSYVAVDLTSNDTTRDKTVSNNLARLWEEHRTDDTHTVHGILEVNENQTGTVKNRLVSNTLAKGWEDHKNKIYTGSPHDIEQANETSSDTTKNKLVSNNQLKTLYDHFYTVEVSSASLSPSGVDYFYEVEHNIGDDWPSVTVYNTQTRKIEDTNGNLKEIESVNEDITRVWLTSSIDIAVKVIK